MKTTLQEFPHPEQASIKTTKIRTGTSTNSYDKGASKEI